MRAALITLPMPGESGQATIAGKSLAQRQLLFAGELGCEAVIAFGSGASNDAISLRHAAESAGLRFQIISNCHALPGAIGSGDSLLVFQPLLLPESRQALAMLQEEGDRMLVVSSGPGVSAGFERIDLDRAWAGVLTMPGRWLGKLQSLPEDAAPHAALLRICLQMRLPELRLSDDSLDDTSWTVIRAGKAAVFFEQSWLAQHLGKTDIAAPSRWLAGQIVARGGTGLLARKWPVFAFIITALALLAGALAASFYGVAWAGFALIAAAVPLLESGLAVHRITRAPFGKAGRLPLLCWLTDGALFSAAILAIDSFWYRAAFPAFVLGAVLILLDRQLNRYGAGLVQKPFRDRGLIAALLALVTAISSAEIAVMAIATLCLGVMLLPRHDSRQ